MLIDRVGISSTRQRIDESVASGTPHQIVTVNLDFLRISLQNPCFRELINQADLAVADGIPLLWAARVRGDPLVERVTGPDLMEMSAGLSAEKGHSLFLLGAAPGVAEMAAAALTRRYPGARIGGVYAPPVGPFSPEEDDRMVSLIRRCRPDILFVAFGCPKQDFWIQQHKKELGVPVAIGVGGTFNYIAGIIPRAPAWAQRASLEWLFRLKHEPRRLWRRYLLEDMPVLLRLVSQRSWQCAGRGDVMKLEGR